MKPLIACDDIVVHRFNCGCKFPGHVLDVSIETADKGKHIVEISLNLFMHGKAPFKFRLMQIYKLLRGEDGSLADFILNPDDIPEMVSFLNRYTSWTSGTGTGTGSG